MRSSTLGLAIVVCTVAVTAGSARAAATARASTLAEAADDTPPEHQPAASDRAAQAKGSAQPQTAPIPAPAAGAVDPAAPAAVVRTLHDALIGAMRDAETLGYAGRHERLAPVVLATFDLAFMASKTAGRHWAEFDAEAQRRWREAFERFTIANYAARFAGYSGESFEELGAEPAVNDTFVVRSKLVTPSASEDDVQLDYRLRETDAGWRIIDVYLHGTVSELALRRAEYASALEREGIDKVVADLDSKVADMAAGKVEGERVD